MDIRIVIAEGHPLIMSGLRAVLSTEPDFRVVGEAVDGMDAQEMAARLDPDVVLVDINLPGASGVEATRQLVRAISPVRVLLLSTFPESANAGVARATGTNGCIDLDVSAREVIDAIRTAALAAEPVARAGATAFVGNHTPPLAVV